MTTQAGTANAQFQVDGPRRERTVVAGARVSRFVVDGTRLFRRLNAADVKIDFAMKTAACSTGRSAGAKGEFDWALPLAHRTDLPVHERSISAESLRLLLRGIAERSEPVPVPLSAFGDDEDDE